jgi:hypothetical protein
MDVPGGLKVEEDLAFLGPDNANDLVNVPAAAICSARGLQSISNRLEVSNVQKPNRCRTGG